MPGKGLNDMIAQFEKYTRISRAENPLLELEIDKLKANLANMEVSQVDATMLEELIRDPKKAQWKQGPPLPEQSFDYEPAPHEVAFIQEIIRTIKDGGKWGIPTTGHEYRIDKTKKEFVLTRDVEHDPDRWHDKTKMILALLGWTMVDKHNSTKNMITLHGRWSVGVFDFNIDTQENPRTPGENFPPGSRGQDAVATLMGSSLVRLGPNAARHIWTKLQAITVETGSGKTSAPWTTKEL